MIDIINLLPDSVANQIAAGEVIQRPASVVKELMENALDAGATDIKLIIKDSGKTLISVVDNGCGMSPTDARMCFERHATSKINNAEDLFKIKTMGFRGEALASIAAIALVELNTKPHDKEIGSQIIIEGSRIKEQTEVATQSGTTFNVKSLFYNTPARRNFLKADIVENRHITEEFTRVTLMHPNINFSYFDNGTQKFYLPAGNLKLRIINLFGKNLNNRLLSIEEKTTVVNISGFVGKPETAKKTRGEQYFFVNRRFIKHPYLNHAVVSAYDELIADNSFPSYFINLEVDPEDIDVNIHPTKTEVNFKDEKAIYSLLKASVKMALGKYSLSPQIDFDVEASLNLNPPTKGTVIKQPTITINPNYDPFKNTSGNEEYRPSFNATPSEIATRMRNNADNWETIYDSEEDEIDKATEPKLEVNLNGIKFNDLGNRYLIGINGAQLILIDRQAAHERVLFDRFSLIYDKAKPSSQSKLFPDMLKFSTPDFELVCDLKGELEALGFRFKIVGDNTIEVNGTPPDLSDEMLTPIIEGMLEHFKLNQMELRIDRRQNLLLSMAKNLSIKPGRKLEAVEIEALIDALVESKLPEKSPSGKPIIKSITNLQIEDFFKTNKL